LPGAETRSGLRILLDENVPMAVAASLRRRQPNAEVFHALEVGLQGSADPDVFRWAQDNECIIVTFDRDFADRRGFAAGEHCGIVRLRVRPTTVEVITQALSRLLESVDDQALRGALVIVGRRHVRVRPGTPSDTRC